MYNYTDYYESYGRIMQFNKNKIVPFHRWYPFVEGYSKEFIQSILKEVDKDSLICLEPFSGSGTTALELQNNGFECFSFEVNPLMYLIASVKLESNYEIVIIKKWFKYICDIRESIVVEKLSSEFKTLYESKGKNKWNYNKEVAVAISKLKVSIGNIPEKIYKDLFTVALASILLDVSNLYRNGKCLSYKKNWKDRIIDETYVFDKFDKKVENELIYDIENCTVKKSVNNKLKLFIEDARIGIKNRINDNSIDLVITSPPYLNSRDYTDTYMIELKTLNFSNQQEIRELREKTIRSHVQIQWKDKADIENDLLKETIDRLEKSALETKVWNNSIISMVRLYFVDIQNIFNLLYKKMKINGKIYFNVSNSAYFNVLINTLEICASIAEKEGFTVTEIRKARNLNTSPQQQKYIDKILEGVIVLEKRGEDNNE